MAHNIHFDKLQNRSAFFTVGVKAWHGLGKVLDAPATAQEAIREACLDYTCVKTGLLAIPNELDQYRYEDLLPVPASFAIVRTDTQDVLGVVGKEYQILQNTDAFSFFDPIVDRGEAIYETAGVLGRGERIFITAKLPKKIMVGNDVIDQYIFITNCHIGKESVIVDFTPIRIVCNNTLNMALNRESRYRVHVRHTQNVVQNVGDASRIMNIQQKASREMENIFNRMAGIRIADTKALELITSAVMPKKEVNDKKQSVRLMNQIEGVMMYYHESPTQAAVETKNTLYGVVNAVSGYYQHVYNHKNAYTRLNSIRDGNAYQKTQRAFSLASALV